MATYKPIQSIVLSSSTASITFSGIDQNYTDLVLTVNGTTGANVDSYCRVNGSSTSLYSYTRLYGTGSGNAASDRSLTQTELKAGNFNTTPNTHVLHFMNYSDTTRNKTMFFNTKESASAIINHACLWRSKNAINSINIYVTSGSFNAGSTFSLYGIKSGAPQALGGDLVTTDGNYWYHTFRTTQTFTPLRPLTADILVVAGGGGGGGYYASGYAASAGGGAGGLLSYSSQSLNATGYTCTVGSGGAGGQANTTNATSGTNSQFGTLTAVVGGGYGGNRYINSNGAGGTGGSGGGGANASGGSPTSGQGNSGGSSASDGAGGGGGAGAVGGNSAGTSGGNGGLGGGGASFTNYLILNAMGSATNTGVLSSGHYYYAGGGGGGKYANGTQGTGGTGGGGAAGDNSAGVAGTANTGGGGGAASYQSGQGTVNAAGGAGGSGIVIVRYPV